MFIALLAVAVIIVLMFHNNLNQKRKTAKIEGWVETQDLDARSPKVYRNYAVGISAKPDIVEKDKVTEFKSKPGGDKARRSDIVQLTAEMLATGKKKGELRYGNDKRFLFTKDTPIIQKSVKRIAWISEQMKWHLQHRSAPGGTFRPGKCSKCAYRTECRDAKKTA
jgi:CRISPR/Cas system-associated exonuclease Cas4 (RecB family)